MGKKKSSGKRSSAAGSSKSGSTASSVSALERQLQSLDGELVGLLHSRTELAERLAAARHAAGKPNKHLAEELAALKRLVAEHPGALPASALHAVLTELESGTRALLQPVRVAYLGPQYSYSHLATLQRFGQGAELVPVATIAAVFDEVQRGQADYGLVPIQNSTDGRVVDTLDRFTRHAIGISGEVLLRIHHHLLGKCPRAEIREVYSKPQALSQCRDWLATHLPAAKTVEIASTAAAAELAAKKSGVAAIASRQAGVKYGLDCIASDIEDNQHNVTRFAVIGGPPAPRTGNDKTALMFEISHRPGSLAEAMNLFKRSRLNLTWIESFPKIGSPDEFLFFVELEGHRDDARVKRALATLEGKAERLEVMGSYARTEPVE